MIKKKAYHQLIPEKVSQVLPEIEELLKPEIKGFSPDYMKEVISIVSCHVRKEDRSAPLLMEYIKKMVPQGDKYLSGLNDLGIIERSGQYIPGSISYKYNFASDYQSKYLSFVLDNAKLIRRIEKVYNDLKKQVNRSVRNHSEQIQFLNELTIDPDYKEYLNTTLFSEYRTI